MKLHADGTTANYIQACRPGAVQVGGRWHETGLIVSADTVIGDWRPADASNPVPSDFAAALALDPELIIFGTGTTLHFPSQALMVGIMGQGIGFEVMATDAACRTYNVLAAEDRRVVAVLL
jgi:uncharacterized protein